MATNNYVRGGPDVIYRADPIYSTIYAKKNKYV